MICIYLLFILTRGQRFFKKEFSLFPTEGEFSQYDLSDFEFQPSSCKMNPYVPFVELINMSQEIYQTKGKCKNYGSKLEYSSMTSNNTHFFALSNGNEVYIYHWKNQIIQQVGQPVLIDSSFKCFNINLYQDFQILVDCYKNNQLFLLTIVNAQPNIVYQFKSFIPKSTKLQQIVNGTNTFIIYGQYFQSYSLLSLISAQFKNLSCYSNQFIDFDIPISISPKIYLITSKEILQFFISSNFKFELTFIFNATYYKFSQILVYENLIEYSQCDQILVLQWYKGYNSFSYQLNLYFGCEYQIIYSKIVFSYHFGEYQPYDNTLIQKIFSNNQFVVLQLSIDKIIFLSINNQNVQSDLGINNKSQLYINADNELFSFGDDIISYKISLLSLQINLTNQVIEQYHYNFTLSCNNINTNNLKIYDIKSYEVRQDLFISIFQIHIQILSQNDTNIYVMHNQAFQQDQISTEVLQNFVGFSGSLLNYTPYQGKTLLNYTQETFQKIGEINQVFYLVQSIQGVLSNILDMYLIGYNNYTLIILLCQIGDFDENYSCQLLNQIDTSIDAKSLKVAYSIYPEIIIIGLSDIDTIYLFQQNQNNTIYYQLNFTFEQGFSDFLVTYQSIIILIPNQEIQLMSLNFTNQFILNQQYINKHFVNVEFNPLQIVLNTQFLSSFLYINNINSVIIVSINQNNIPIPITFIPVNITIKQINLINQQIILSYVCNNNQNICFQVWNVQNLPKFFYVKSLQSVENDNQILIESDNLFLYITFKNHTVYIYNPILPQHMSLYYMVELTLPISFTQAFYDYYNNNNNLDQSLIFYNNSFYLLSESQSIQISFENDNHVLNNSIRYPQIIYNYSVTSILNQTALYQTPNQSIMLFSNFTIFQPLNFMTINLTYENLNFREQNFTYPLSLILDRQISYCGSTDQNQTYDLSGRCSLSYFAPNTSKITNWQNYSLITSINNYFFALQNNQTISILYDNLTQITNLSYSNLNFSECLKSTSQNYTLHSICQNDSSQYWLIFQINNDGTQITLTNFTQLNQTFSNISKISCILNQMFILGSLNQQIKQLYWFNQSNSSFQQIIMWQYFNEYITECKDFSTAQFLQANNNQQSNQIIIFYILQDYFQVIYQVMQIASNFATFLNVGYVIIPDCFNQKCQRNDQTYIVFYSLQVQIIQVYYESVFILLSDSDFSYIVNANIYEQSQQFQESFGAVVKTIPNYGNSDNLGYSIYQNNVLMQQFQLNDQYNQPNEFIVGTYYLIHLTETFYLDEPILMYGSFTTTSNEYAMIVNEQQQIGTCLYFYNNYIYNYSISKWNVTCHYQQNKNQFNVSVYCQNVFSNGIYNITFNLPEIEKSHKRWIYTLISIIILLLIAFYYQVKIRTRGSGYINNEIEL